MDRSSQLAFSLVRNILAAPNTCSVVIVVLLNKDNLVVKPFFANQKTIFEKEVLSTQFFFLIYAEIFLISENVKINK